MSETSWGTSATANSFAWALAQANSNLAADTISISPISDTLIIQGNGATLVGNPSFVSSGGTLSCSWARAPRQASIIP